MAIELIQGEALDVLTTLEAESFDLIYLDPPFNTGVDREGGAGVYADRFDDFEGFLRPHLEEARRVLKATGSLYLHLDPNESHYAKIWLDEIFGRANFRREIIWRIGWVSGYKSTVRNWVRNHDVILYYTASEDFTFHKPYLRTERRGRGVALGQPLDDVWNASPLDRLDSIQVKSFSKEKTGYPTQKPVKLLTRIISASSNRGDRVLDFFAGSGTTGAASRLLERDAVLVDRSDAAISTIRQRLNL